MASQKAEHWDVVVVGGGPGGYPAAFDAADRGMRVALVNDEPRLGGVCLNRGCIPSKALLHVARLINESQESAEWGITFSKPKIDLDRLRDWVSQQVVGQLTGGIAELCRARGVHLVEARGTFLDSNTLKVAKKDSEEGRITFDHAVLASGSSPIVPPIFQIGDERVMDSTGALKLADIPDRLLVIGGGYIGLEMGTVYAALGSKVTVVEMMGGLLPGVDRDLIRPLKKHLDARFEAIHLNTAVKELSATRKGIVAKLEGEVEKKEQTFDRVLVSVGRRPNSKDLGLETTKVELTEKGFVKVDQRRRTSDPSILAIGDVAGEPMLAHKATREAKIVIGALAGEPDVFDNVAIPAVVFTDPEIAWCGLTETEAKASGRSVKVARFSWGASGRARTLGRTEGLTKLIVDAESQRILGVGIVGVGAGELIAEGVLAVEMAAVARDVADSIHAHPTLSETLMEAAESIFGQATHQYRKQR